MLLMHGWPACAQAEGLQSQIDEVLGTLDFSGLNDITVQLEGERALGVRDAVREIAGGASAAPDDLLTSVFRLLVEQFSKMGKLMLSVMLPVLLSGLLTNTFCAADGELDALGKNACLVLILIPVVLCVLGELEHVRSTITTVTERMDRMLPMLLTLLTALGGSASQAFLHPVVVAASGSMVYLAREVILRMVMYTCAVTTINHLSDRAHLSRMARLLRGAVCWLLGISFTVFLGAMSVQGVCSASVDGVAIRAAKYAVDNFVPIVGGMFSDTMDTLLGCTLIVKNALGVTAVLVLAGGIAAPMIRTFAAAAVLKLCSALLEPVAQTQVVEAIDDFAGTLVLFLITMLCVGTMYFLLIVQLLLVGNLTVMFR